MASALDMRLIQVQGRDILLLQDDPKAKSGGGFAAGDTKRLEETLRRNPQISEVWFDSGGGLEVEGLAIGRAIRRAGLSTRVPKGGSCASACADAFMGGVARRVDEGGRYGIHMATIARSENAIRVVMRAVVEAASTANNGKTEIDTAAISKVIMDIEKLSANGAAKWGGYVLEMGASPRIVQLGTETSANSMNWLTRRQMVDLNVINVDE